MATGGSSIAVMNQYSQKHGLNLVWDEVSCTGPPHQRTFVLRLKMGEHVTEGIGSSKKAAKEDAARKMMAKLHDDGYLESDSVQEQRSKITILQELCQKNGRSLPTYSEISRVGPSNDPTFTFAVEIQHPWTGEQVTAQGIGKSKDKAKTNAAAAILQQLGAHQSYEHGDIHYPSHAIPFGDAISQYTLLETRTTSDEVSRMSRTGPLLISRGQPEGVHPDHPVPKPRTRPLNAGPLAGEDAGIPSSSSLPLSRGSAQNYNVRDTRHLHFPTATVATQSMGYAAPDQPPHSSYQERMLLQSQGLPTLLPDATALLPDTSTSTGGPLRGLPTLLPDATALLPDTSTSTGGPLRGLDSRLSDLSTTSSSATPPPAWRDPTHSLQSATDQMRHCVSAELSGLYDLPDLPHLPSIDTNPEPMIAVESTDSSGAASVDRPVPKPRKSKPATSTIQDTQRECGGTMQAEGEHSQLADDRLGAVPPPTTQAVTRATQAPQSQAVRVAQAESGPRMSEIPDMVGSPLEFVMHHTAHLGALKVVPLEGKDQNDRHVCFLSLSQVVGCETMTALGAGLTVPEAEQDAARCLWRQLTGQGKIVR